MFRFKKADVATTVKNPAKGYVSLRATIPGALSQTILRAYAIGG